MNVKFKVKYQVQGGKVNTKTREVHLTESQGIRDAWMLIGRLATLEEDKLVGIDLAEDDHYGICKNSKDTNSSSS